MGRLIHRTELFWIWMRRDAKGKGAWPGREKAASLPFEEKAKCIKSELSKKIKAAMGTSFNPSTFIPYIMMYEFEGLLFSDCVKFSKGINYPDLQPKFQMIRNQFQSPEEINDSPNTAPSKRIEKLFPGYQKPINGTLAILGIGLETIRKECTNFDLWIKTLEETK